MLIHTCLLRKTRVKTKIKFLACFFKILSKKGNFDSDSNSGLEQVNFFIFTTDGNLLLHNPQIIFKIDKGFIWTP